MTLDNFWLCFVPLFVAMDVVGLLPIFLGISETLTAAQKRKAILQSVITAFAVSIGFLYLGQMVFSYLGITLDDFMVAGGLLLFAFAVMDLMSVSGAEHAVDPESLGAVPLGVPLMVGPAVLTTLLLVSRHGMIPTIASLIVNIIIIGTSLWFSSYIVRLIGKTGAKAISKIVNLILAAFGIMMIRVGVIGIIASQ